MRSCENNIKMYFKVVGYKDVDQIRMTQGRIH